MKKLTARQAEQLSKRFKRVCPHPEKFLDHDHYTSSVRCELCGKEKSPMGADGRP